MTMYCLRCNIRIHDDAPHYKIEVLGFDYTPPVKILKPHEPVPPPLPKAILTKTSGIIYHCMRCFEEREKFLSNHIYWIHDQEVQEITDD